MATIDFSLAQVRLLIEGGPAFIGPILHGTVDSNRNSNGWFMRTALQIIKVRSKNNQPNSRRTRPSSSYATFQPQENNRA